MQALQRFGVGALLGAAVFITGCGGYEPGPTAVDVLVKQRIDSSGGLYAEGSLGYVRVETTNGDKLVEERISPMTLRTSIRLDPGEYRFVSFQRPCDGSCDDLDPPTDRCDLPATVERREELRLVITLRPGEGCTISARHRYFATPAG